MTSGIPITLTHRAMFIKHDGFARCRNTEIDRDKAMDGSEALRLAMRREFGKLALRHGISMTDAKLLLMNGVQP